MSNTYTKIYLHIVFAVKGREAFLPPTEQIRIHHYIAKLLREMDQYPIAIGGIENHIHILIAYKPDRLISQIVRDIKTTTTKFINTHHLIPFRFAWQRGYACFSYSHSQIGQVKRYIEHQHEHHNNMTLREEIKRTYERFGIEYDDQFIFEE